MTCVQRERMDLRTPDGVVWVRQKVRQWAKDMGFGLVDQTKLVTAASELARNTVDHGGGGWAILERLEKGSRSGIRVIFEDNGPGIEDVERAMGDGYSTGNGLGMGLSGSRRLVNEFAIESTPGAGTRVTVVKWK